MSLEEARGTVHDALRAGEPLIAHDLATKALADHQDDLDLQHACLVALARSGGTARAAQLFDTWALAGRAAGLPDGGRLAVDVAALGARLVKDRALTAQGEARRLLAAEATDAYARIHRTHGGSYPLVNAATMALVAGQPDRARHHASDALRALAGEAGDDLWTAATEAEAALVLGDLERAAEALERTATAGEERPGDLASTRRQLRLLVGEARLPEDVLAPIRAPDVLHYTGHMPPWSRHDDAAERVEQRIVDAASRIVEGPGVLSGHGSLAAGTDLLVAEVLLDAGVELHVVLPFPAGLFRQTSVGPPDMPDADGWLRRFDACLERATSVTVVLEQPDPDPTLYAYAAEVAMGEALLRAERFATGARQLAAWDGNPPSGPAGTAADVATWRRTGRTQVIVEVPGDRPSRAQPRVEEGRLVRSSRSMLFGDVSGFSRLDDRGVVAVVEECFGRFAGVLEADDDAIVDRNTWGDGLFITFDDVVAAARSALGMQAAMEDLPRRELGLPPELGLRLGGHAAPVITGWDPIRGHQTMLGSEVNRTARIEPATPVGQVYVSDRFAALLAISAPDDFVAEYVGSIPLAKDFGAYPMYVLTPRR